MINLFSPKHRSKTIIQVNISSKDVKAKLYSKVTYLGIYDNAGLHKYYIEETGSCPKTSGDGYVTHLFRHTEACVAL